MTVLRFATYNIASGRSPATGRPDLDRLSDAVTQLDADVLVLQEVDRDQPRSGNVDLTELVASAMSADHRVFAPALYGTPGSRWTAAGEQPQDGPAYGCAIVSRLPLLDVTVFRMPAAPVALPLWVPGVGPVLAREEPRVAIFARVEVAEGCSISVVGTHLPFVPGWKGIQLKRIAHEARSRPDPLLLLGDLNLRGGRPAQLTGYRRLVTASTYPAPRPLIQLDHVLLRGELAGAAPVVGTSVPRLDASDHRPAVVDLDLVARASG